MNNIGNCVIAQSGGPTSVINSSLAGVMSKVFESDNIKTVYGAINGIQGLMKENFLDLTKFKGDEQAIKTLKLSPAMYLGSCRYKLPSDYENSEDFKTIFEIFKKYDIKYFFYIGGNDSMDTVAKLSIYAEKIGFDIAIMGVPKTIDNDLACIDHTPGFGSAAKFIATSMLEVAHDTYIYDMKTVLIVEIMGRNAGWLTASSVLARNEYSKAPHLIYLPERAFNEDKFIDDINALLSKQQHVIVAVSEGIKNEAGQYISAKSEQVDQFGHVMLNGTGKYLEQLVSNKIGCKVRSIELNVLQRSAGHIASLTDSNEAYELGRQAANAALNGKTGEMAIVTRTSNSPYTVNYSTASIHDIANVEKTIPDNWINEAGNDVTEELVDYLRPLIEGEANHTFTNGLPTYLPVTHLVPKK
ncbi:MAG: 6-phosphofructokinase [Lachnospiraceae bacterium]|nr:6-phosphofructokinase [Lachnospiraceae bacterium]